MNAAVERQNRIDWSVAGRPMPGPSVSGDLHVVEVLGREALLAAIDGAGHGEAAKTAAQTAADVLKRYASEPVVALVKRCHEALLRTRGAVMTVVKLDPLGSTLTWVGVGNVEGRLFRAGPAVRLLRESLLLRAGVVGYLLPPLHESTISISPSDLLILATDGIRAEFDTGFDLSATPKQIAEGILSRNFKGHDDALVLAARCPRKWNV